MTIETLQEHLESLEKDQSNFAREGDTAMQNLKQEKQELHLKAHDACKAIEVDKLEIKSLKCHMEMVQKERKGSQSKVSELENNVAKIKKKLSTMNDTHQHCIDESQEYLNTERKKFLSIVKERGILQNIGQTSKSKERDQEFQDKELGKLGSEAKNLEYSNTFESLCIEKFERKTTLRGNTEIAAAFQHKLKSARDQRKRFVAQNVIIQCSKACA